MGRCPFLSPTCDQRQTIVAIDRTDDFIEKLLVGDGVLVEIGNLPMVYRSYRLSSLPGANMTAIAERHRDVPMAKR